MKHEFNLKERNIGTLPPEKLLSILRGIFPDDVADDVYDKLMDNKESENINERV